MAAADGETPRLPLPQSLPEAAAWYAAHRTRVFPLYGVHDGVCDCGNPECGNVGKHPRTAHGFKDATSDPLEVANWWATWPNANIGMPTGPEVGVFVVDIDPRHGGLQTLQGLMDDHGGLPETREVATGGGGMHLYFKCPDPPLQSTQNGLGPGIDTKGVGGYVVLPPSAHKSGNHYRWENEGLPPARVPPWVPEVLHRTNGHTAPGADGAAPSGGGVDWDRVFGGVPEGQRDDTLFRAASSLRNMPGMKQRLAEEMLLRANENFKPPLPTEEVRKKVAYVWGKYEAPLPDEAQGETLTLVDLPDDAIQIVTLSPLGPLQWTFENLEKSQREFDAEFVLRFLMPGTPLHSYRQRINLQSSTARESCRRELEAVYGKDVKWAKLISETFNRVQEHHLGKNRSKPFSSIALVEDLEMLVAGIAPAEGTTILFGAGSGTKTFLALQLAICISKGIPFLGRPCAQRNVLYVDYESEEGPLNRRAARLLRGLGYDPRDPATTEGLHYLWADGIPLLDQVDAIKRAAQQEGCGVVVIDHAALACGGEPEKSDAALRVKRALSRIKLPCILVAHITGDGETNPAQVRRPFGSVFWSNLARRTWYIQRAEEQEGNTLEVGLYCRKNNDGRKPADFGVQFHFEDPNGPITIEPAELRATPRLMQSQRPEEQVWQALEEPRTLEELHDLTSIPVSSLKKTLYQNPKRFMNQANTEAGGRGQRGVWARVGLL